MTQALVNVLFMGSVYALFALGYALTFAVTGNLNLAHPVVFAIGALVAALLVKVGHPLWIAAVGGTIAGGVAGLVIDRVAYWPLRRRGIGAPGQLISGIAALLLSSGLLLARFGEKPATFPAHSIGLTALRVGAASISGAESAAIATCVFAMICLHFVLSRTRLGLAMRAVAGNPVAALASGVAVEAIIAQTAFIASALGALAGIAFAAVTRQATAEMPMSLLLSGFAAVLLGGLESVPGTIAAAYAVALVQSAVELAMPAGGRDLAAFALVLVAVALFPRGVALKRTLRSV